MTATVSVRSRVETRVAPFAAALARAAAAARRTTVNPVLACVYWDGESLTGTDLDMWVTAWVTDLAPPLVGSCMTPACISATKLLQVVKGLAYPEMTLDWDDRSLAIQNGRDRYKLVALAPSGKSLAAEPDKPDPLGFPLPPDVTGWGLRLPAATLGRALDAVRYAIATGHLEQSARPMYQGVHVVLGTGLTTEATDTHLIAHHTVVLADQDPLPGAADAILPWPVVDRLLALLADAAEDDLVDLVVGDQQVQVAQRGRWSVVGRLIAEKFPPTQRLFEDARTRQSFALPRTAWVAALGRARSLADDLASRVLGSLHGGMATLQGADAKGAESAVQVSYKPAEEGSEGDFCLNAESFREALRHLDGETVRLDLGGPKDSVHLCDAAGSRVILAQLAREHDYAESEG